MHCMLQSLESIVLHCLDVSIGAGTLVSSPQLISRAVQHAWEHAFQVIASQVVMLLCTNLF